MSAAEMVERQAALFAAVIFVSSLAAFATRRHLVGFVCALGAAATAAILFAAARPESGRIGAAAAILCGAGALATAALGLVARWHADSGSAVAGSLRRDDHDA